MTHRALILLLGLGACDRYLDPPQAVEDLARDAASSCDRVVCNRIDLNDDGVASTADLVYALQTCTEDDTERCYPDVDGDGVGSTSDLVVMLQEGFDLQQDITCDALPACPLAFDDPADIVAEGRIRSLFEVAAEEDVVLDPDVLWAMESGESVLGLVDLDVPVLHPNGVIEAAPGVFDAVERYVDDFGDTDSDLAQLRLLEAYAVHGLFNPADETQYSVLDEYRRALGIPEGPPTPPPVRGCRASCNLVFSHDPSLRIDRATVYQSCSGYSDASLLHEAVANCDTSDDAVSGTALVHQECDRHATVQLVCFAAEEELGDCGGVVDDTGRMIPAEQCTATGFSQADWDLYAEAYRYNIGVSGNKARAMATGTASVKQWSSSDDHEVPGGQITVRAIAESQTDHCGRSESPWLDCAVGFEVSPEGPPSIGVECPLSAFVGGSTPEDDTIDTLDVSMCNGAVQGRPDQRVQLTYGEWGDDDDAEPRHVDIPLIGGRVSRVSLHGLTARADTWHEVVSTSDYGDVVGGSTLTAVGMVEARDQLYEVRSMDDVTTGGRPFSCGTAPSLIPEGSRYELGQVEVVEPAWFDAELGAYVQGLPMETVTVAAGCYGGPSVAPRQGSCEDVGGDWPDGWGSAPSCR